MGSGREPVFLTFRGGWLTAVSHEKRMPEKPTLRDVATVAGVSKSTAQRALANDPRCAEKTRLKVAATAARMGYVPDPVFAAVGSRRRSRRTDTAAPVAYIVGKKPGTQNVGARYMPHCKNRASELGYRLEEIDLARLEAPHRIWQTLYARGFVGVIIGSVRKDFHEILLANDLFPTVCVGRLDPLPFHTIRPSIQAATRLVWEKTIACGYRRIGATVFSHQPALEDDFARFSTVAGSHLLSFPDEPLIPPLRCGFDEQSEFIPWVKRNKPDAIIGFHDGLIDRLEDAGLRVPEDIGFASLHRRTRRASGIRENVRACADRAVNFLDQMVRLGERGPAETPINLMIEGTWVDGDSLPGIRRK